MIGANSWLSKVLVGLVAMGTLTMTWSCSSSGDEAGDEAVEPSKTAAVSEKPTEGGDPAPDEAPADDDATKQAAAAEAAPEPPVEAPASAVATPPPAPPVATAPEGPKVTRWVRTFAANIRSAPSKESPVVTHMARGHKIEVSIDGEWAKIGEGQFISTNTLSDTDPSLAPVKAKKASKGKHAKKKAKKKKKK